MKKYKVTFRDGRSVIVTAKDSVASDLYSEIKKAYPNANVTHKVRNHGDETSVSMKILNPRQLGSGLDSFLNYIKNKYSKYDILIGKGNEITIDLVI